MSPERSPLAEAQHVVTVSNLAAAMLRAQNYDATQVALGVATISTVLVGADPKARTALAMTMLRLARELDPDMVGATWQ